jgi:hypothetical protein
MPQIHNHVVGPERRTRLTGDHTRHALRVADVADR